MPYFHRHDVTPFLVLVLTKHLRNITFMGDWNRRGIDPRHSVGLKVGNGGESKPLYIFNRNHVYTTSTVYDYSAAFLATLGKGTKD